MPLIHRKKHQHEEDGSAEKEKEQHEQEERKSRSFHSCPSFDVADHPEWEGEEYDVLLRFVKEESERLKSAKSGGEDEEEEATYKRVWYAPWRKVKVGGSTFKASLHWPRPSGGVAY